MNLIRTIAACSAMALSACSTPPGADGIPPESYLPSYAAEVAQACVSSDFVHSEVRRKLVGAGFVEQKRPFSHQFEKFPEGAEALTQGAVVPYDRPCKPKVDARFARRSMAAVASVLVRNGFKPDAKGQYFEKGNRRIRLTASGLEMGGPYTINVQPD